MWLDYIKSFLLYQRFMSNAQWCIIKAWCFYCIEETEIRLREDVSLEILWHNDEERGNTQIQKSEKIASESVDKYWGIHGVKSIWLGKNDQKEVVCWTISAQNLEAFKFLSANVKKNSYKHQARIIARPVP